jgi:hypothetical protein
LTPALKGEIEENWTPFRGKGQNQFSGKPRKIFLSCTKMQLYKNTVQTQTWDLLKGLMEIPEYKIEIENHQSRFPN